MFFGLVLGGVAALSANAATKVLQFTVTAPSLVTSNACLIDNPALNAKPALRLIVTQRFTGTYNPHPVGVWYSTERKHWGIVNEDAAALPVGASFNILATTGGARVNASTLNSELSLTFFTTAAKKPLNRLLVTHLWNPSLLLGGVYLPHNLGLFYNGGVAPRPDANKWSVCNLDGAPPNAAAYFVFDSTALAGSFAHTSAMASITLNQSALGNAATLAQPNAVVFVTPRVGVRPALTGPSDRTLGVFYTGTDWTIFTEDQSAFGQDLFFNVLVFPAPIP